MPVCNFFLQGRCRYGEKCWNEHPGGGRSRGSHNRSSAAPQPRDGGGYGNRVWVNPSQRSGGAYIKSTSFSSHESEWGPQGGGGDWGSGGPRDNIRSSDFSFSSQDRFATLNSSGRGAGGGGDDDDKKLETVQLDMATWETSGQWGFSCYHFKTLISGFCDLSPEELRLEYYSARATGDLQGYINGVNQLLSKWRNRVQQLKIMNVATRAALVAEIDNPMPSSNLGPSTLSNGFGSVAPAPPSSFSFADPRGGFASSPSSSCFGAASHSQAGFGSPADSGASSFCFATTVSQPTAPPTFGSSTTSAPSASSFTFATSGANKMFGSASGFSISGLGSSSGSGSSTTVGGGSAGQFGTTTAAPIPIVGACETLFTPESDLTTEELNQFKAKRFTLGQIPSKAPPVNILAI